MGIVFLGKSPGGRLLAVKVIREDLAGDREFRGRFQWEVTAARSVSGLFTAPVVDADLDARLPWLATAYVAGPSLSDAVNRHGPLPAESVLALMAGLAEGLAAIHGAGLVHRDLKPGNVLLAADGPRVIDFGVSRVSETATVTQSGMVIGSPGFMSPEQAEGGTVGPASDVFSLGSVLVFAATGEGPFGRGPTAALVYRVVHAPAGLDRVPAGVRPLLVRCLAKDPAARPDPAWLLARLGERGGAGFVEGWLPAPIMADFRARTAAMTRSRTDPGQAPVPAPSPAGTPPGAAPPVAVPAPRRPAGRQRRGLLAVAGAAVAVGLAAGAVAVAQTGGAKAGRGQSLSAATVPTVAYSPATTLPAIPPPPPAPKRRTHPRAAAVSRTSAPAPDPSTRTPPPRRLDVPPATPATVTAAAHGQYEIVVSWAGNAARGTGFDVDNGCPGNRCGGGGSTLATTTGQMTSTAFAVTPGTYQCFRVRAFNAYGASAWSRYACAATPGLVVSGAQPWTDSGVEVQAGDRVGIEASGVVTIAGTYPAFAAGPGGNASCVPARDHPAAMFPAPDLPCYSLIARIGDGAPFEAGASTLVMPGSGELRLGINDGTLTGNSGAWTVNIKFGTLPPAP
jgi:hypothetical protein